MSEQGFRWQDEILQMMFWMKGEHLDSAVTSQQLNRFLELKPEELAIALQRLLEASLIAEVAEDGNGQRYELTKSGLSEGRRRFADEFSSYLGKENHAECSEPNCDCHSPDFEGICGQLKN